MTDQPDLTDMLAYLATELLGWQAKDGGYNTPNGMRPQYYFFHGIWRLEDELFRYLSSGNGMLEIIEAMREREYGCVIDITAQPNYIYYVAFDSAEKSSAREDSRLPEAVARAAYAALQESEHG